MSNESNEDGTTTHQNQVLNPDIEDVAFILNGHGNEIVKMLQKVSEKYDDLMARQDGSAVESDVLFEAVFSYSIIMMCSFLDEWDDQINHFIGQGIERDRFITMRKIAKPASDGIKEFSGLRDFRSKILAHNHRVGHDGNRNAFRGNYLVNLKAPVSLGDYLFLANCIFYCQVAFNSTFPEYTRSPSDFIAEHTDLNFAPGMSEQDYLMRIVVMHKQIDDLTKQHLPNYRNPKHAS